MVRVGGVRGKGRQQQSGVTDHLCACAGYPDDDYRDQPIRDRTPSPAPYEGGAPLALEPTTSWRPRAIQY